MQFVTTLLNFYQQLSQTAEVCAANDPILLRQLERVRAVTDRLIDSLPIEPDKLQQTTLAEIKAIEAQIDEVVRKKRLLQ